MKTRGERFLEFVLGMTIPVISNPSDGLRGKLRERILL